MTLIRNGAIFAAGLVLAFLASGPARAQLSTLDVATKTIVAVPQCASYRVGGACFFLKCGFFGCSVKTSVRVRHFAPDLVVSVYHDRATHPWDYGRFLASQTDTIGEWISQSVIDSAGTRTKAAHVGDNTLFRDVDAIGNPVNILSMIFSGGMPSLNAPSSVPVPTTSELMGFLGSAPSSIAAQWRTIPDSYGGGQGATAKAEVKISEILRTVGGPLATLNTGLGKLGRSLPTSGFSGVGIGIGGGGSSGGAGFGVFCPAGATPFGLYYQSFLDTLTWRDILPLEMLYPASWLPGMREIGSGLTQSWGSVYPRTGSLVQQHPVKGGAVLAQRVADIVGQRNQPHVYRPLDVQPGGWIWFGDQGIHENDNNHTRWQRLYPDAETSCSAFGGDDRFSLTSYGDAHVAASRDVVFNMWRRQECCQRLSGIYLGSISIR